MKIGTTWLIFCRLILSHAAPAQETSAREVEIEERERVVRRHLDTSTQDDATRKRDLRTSRVVVRYSNDQGRLDALALGGNVYHDFTTEKIVVLDLDDDSIANLERYDANVLSVEGDHVWKEQGFLEANYDLQQVRRLAERTPYGIAMVQADQVKMGHSPVTVCVADSGAARNHPDLKTAQLSGTDRSNMKWNEDFRGHGTHVVGTLSAAPDNGIGVRGIGEIPLHITRALDNNGEATESDVWQSVKQCAASGARIISMSLGGYEMTLGFREYVNKLYREDDILIIGASGNDGKNMRTWPGSLSTVVSVAAVNEKGEQWMGPSYGSNMGPWVELAAPGEMILSTTVTSKGKYEYAHYSGTSMAVPHVSGVAALIWSHHPNCKNYQIRYALAISAKDLNIGKGCNEKFGHGLIQARAALEFLNENPCRDADFGERASQGGCYMNAAKETNGNERMKAANERNKQDANDFLRRKGGRL